MRKKFYELRKIGRFIKRLINWIPILWNQEDWDIGYLYELMKIKLKEIRNCLLKDDLHLYSDKYARQIDICLAYLDRYQNWQDYIEYPMDDIKFVKCKDNNSRMIYKNKYNEIKRKKVQSYEEFNYEMFWKRFKQWHRHWWC